LEINARSSGTTGARALCGFNEPKMIADYLTKGKRPEYAVKEQTILRYWKELVVDNELVETMAKRRTLTQDNPIQL
jgi:carbamoyl-phosphate synthase large subunit